MSLADPQGKKVLNAADNGALQMNTHEAYGELLIGATAVQETIASAGTAQELADATNMAAGESLNCTVSATTGRITVPGGAGGGKYLVTATGQILGVNAKLPQIGIAKNGTEDAGTTQTFTMAATAAYQGFALSKILDLDVDDYVSLFVDTNTSCDTVDVRALSFRVHKIKDDTGI